MFSCVSNLRSFLAIYLKFAGNVDILEQIMNAKFENERGKDNRSIPGEKIGKILFSSENDFTGLYFIVATSKLQPSVVMDTGNNLLA